jgi:arylsulfatase A-like enzyme
MPVSITHLVMQLFRWWYNDGLVPEVVAPADVAVPPYYPDTATVRADIARHYNNIAFMDQQVGAILAQLEADGLADSTIVIWTTDHGDGLPRAKRDLYDSGIKVPMIIRWPEAFRPGGVEPGAVDERLISFVDLGPAILSLAGVAVPATMQGRNFTASNVVPRQYVYASRDRIDETMDRQRAVRDARYKYLRSWYPQQAQGSELAFRNNIDMVREMQRMYDAGQLNDVQKMWYEPPGAERLYDLQQDPFEIHNVVDAPQYQATLQRMRGAMDDWLARVDDGSDEPEDTMVARIERNGERRITPPPTLSVSEGLLTITPTMPGHSLEYRLGDGPWRLYTSPVKVAPNLTLEARAVRYGWEESEVVSGKQ